MLRRELFRRGGMLLAGAVAFPPSVFAETTPNTYFIEVSGQDPLFRAASLSLRARDDQGQFFKGKGGLARIQDTLGIVTVNHVIRGKHDLQFEIPGHPFAKIDPATLRATQMRFGSVDQAVFIPLPSEQKNLLEDLVGAEILSPLHIATSKPEIGELIAQPNGTNGYDLFEVKGQIKFSNEIKVESPAFVPVCKGKSGTPYLRVSGNQVLPEVVGMAKNFLDSTRLSRDTESPEFNCSLDINIADTLSL